MNLSIRNLFLKKTIRSVEINILYLQQKTIKDRCHRKIYQN